MSFIPSSRRPRLLRAVLAAAFILPALYGIRHPSPPNPDEYEMVADCFAKTGSYCEYGKLTGVREPAYPMTLGLFYKILGHDNLAAFLLNGLLAAGAALGLFVGGKRLFDEETGLLAASISAFYPPFIFYASQPRREIGLVFLSVMSVLSLISAREGGLKRCAAAGVVNALTALACTTYLPFGLATAPLLLLWLGRKDLLLAVKSAAVYALFFVLLYSLWPLRNYRAFHTFVLGTTAGAGAVFYVNQIVPSEVGGLAREGEIIRADPVIIEGAGIHDGIALEKFYWKSGVERVKADPMRYLRLVAKRFFVEAWRVTPRERNYGLSYRLLWWAGLLTDGWIVPLGLIGLLLWRFNPPEGVFVPGFVASVNLAYSLIFFILRYRVPVMPWLILLASLTIVRAAKFGKLGL
ncbi:MAG: glycosyltransferase family 39 protein [Elusimicrobia bacterium]|nr:glycosyltransferase family 39 protein [Elusimicrobiota bacterium]